MRNARVVVSLHGIGAHVRVSRAAIFDAVFRRPELAALVPFVRRWYGAQSTYLWYDHEGVQHDIVGIGLSTSRLL